MQFPRAQLGLGLLSLAIACADEENPIAPDHASVAVVQRPQAGVLTDPFFAAWSWPGYYTTYPIMTQQYDPVLNPDAERVWWKSLNSGDVLASWAQDHRGKIYHVGDEPENPEGWYGEYALDSAANFAADYCEVVLQVDSLDPTARFAPGGFTPAALTQYLDTFLYHYRNGSCASVPIHEWEFNHGVGGSQPLANFYNPILSFINWVNQDPTYRAPVVVGSWHLDDGAGEAGAIPDSDPAYLDRLRQAMSWFKSQTSISMVRYLNFETYKTHAYHELIDTESGYFTAEGRVYGNIPQLWLADTYGRRAVLTEYNVHGGLQFRRVYWRPDVWMGGVRYHRAIGLHAPSSGTGYADFRIPAGTRYFQSAIGLASNNGSECYGSARVNVYVDDNLRWTQDVGGLTGSVLTQTPDLDVEGASVLRLEADPLGSNYCDHTTWGDPYFSTAAISISGPSTITAAGSYSWSATVTGLYATDYTITWQESLNGGATWSTVGGGGTYTRNMPAGVAYTLMLRASLTAPSGTRAASTNITDVNTLCSPSAC